MNLLNRIKKLEKHIVIDQKHWAAFVLDGNYSNQEEIEKAKQQLLDEYVAKGNPTPYYRIFINPIPGSVTSQY